MKVYVYLLALGLILANGTMAKAEEMKAAGAATETMDQAAGGGAAAVATASAVPAETAPAAETTAVKVENKVCPVCGHVHAEGEPTVDVEHNGKIYHICSLACAEEFKKDPEKYIKMMEEAKETPAEEKMEKMEGKMEGHMEKAADMMKEGGMMMQKGAEAPVAAPAEEMKK